jgi:adenine-specific DNA-methyltransferase
MRRVSRIRYIGSKARIASAILDLVGVPSLGAGRFVDLFAGAGWVSREAASRGWRVKANDFLLSAIAVTTAHLCSESDVSFENLGGYQKVVDELNATEPLRGFIFREYTPSGSSRSGHERKYFTRDNGALIDGMRRRIEDLFERGEITSTERLILIADLLSAANSVANTAGTYGCFLSYWSSNALNRITLNPTALLATSQPFEVSCLDAFHVPVVSSDTVYLDPPYTKRHYPAYYHILETIAAADEPEVHGVTGLRPWQDKSSPFCYKRRALGALDRLVRIMPARRLFLSYSSEGHLGLDQIASTLGMYGCTHVHELGSLGRYRPNQGATENGTHVKEFLVELVKKAEEVKTAL